MYIYIYISVVHWRLSRDQNPDCFPRRFKSGIPQPWWNASRLLGFEFGALGRPQGVVHQGISAERFSPWLLCCSHPRHLASTVTPGFILLVFAASISPLAPCPSSADMFERSLSGPLDFFVTIRRSDTEKALQQRSSPNQWMRTCSEAVSARH